MNVRDGITVINKEKETKEQSLDFYPATYVLFTFGKSMVPQHHMSSTLTGYLKNLSHAMAVAEE